MSTYISLDTNEINLPDTGEMNILNTSEMDAFGIGKMNIISLLWVLFL